MTVAEKAKYRKYYNDMVMYVKPQGITSECAEIAFYNLGNVNMYVNGILFAPGTGISFDGNAGELDVTRYNVKFDSTIIGTGTVVNPACFVIRKVYVD